ncbi:unnamed protein product, partial [Nesidiocoris tenuis]
IIGERESFPAQAREPFLPNKVKNSLNGICLRNITKPNGRNTYFIVQYDSSVTYNVIFQPGADRGNSQCKPSFQYMAQSAITILEANLYDNIGIVGSDPEALESQESRSIANDRHNKPVTTVRNCQNRGSRFYMGFDSKSDRLVVSISVIFDLHSRSSGVCTLSVTWQTATGTIRRRPAEIKGNPTHSSLTSPRYGRILQQNLQSGYGSQASNFKKTPIDLSVSIKVTQGERRAHALKGPIHHPTVLQENEVSHLCHGTEDVGLKEINSDVEYRCRKVCKITKGNHPLANNFLRFTFACGMRAHVERGSTRISLQPT